MSNKNIIKIKNITKTYSSTVALDNVSVTFKKEKVTSIYGPNGAGKSTLIKIICGEEKANKGSIFLNNTKVEFKTYKEALKRGISYLPQDFGLLNNLTVLENIAISQNQLNSDFIYSKKEFIKYIENTKSKILPFPDENKVVEKLTVYEKQLLAIHKALFFKSEIIIFDESTTNITKDEFRNFVKVIENLKKQGKTIIFISHKLDEVFSISDNLLILKEGKCIKSENIENINKNEVIELFISQKQNISEREVSAKSGKILCDINMNIENIPEFSIEIAQGELISLEANNTVLNLKLGYILFEKLKQYKNIKVGIIPASREEEAIFSNLNIKDNLLINVINLSEFRDKKNQNKLINKIAKELNLIYRDWNQNINELSGGNKQKVVFGRWILSDFDILILIEPTSGIDIETKEIIHSEIMQLKNKGKSFVLITSDEGEQEALQTRKILINQKAMIN